MSDGATFREKHIITAQQFVEGDYTRRIAQNECKVYKLWRPPSDDAPASQAIFWYASALSSGISAVLERIVSIEVQGGVYIGKSSPGGSWACDTDSEFIVFDIPAQQLGGFYKAAQ